MDALALAERVANWQQKALREAKRHTAWVAPDEAYEVACRDFLFQMLDPSRPSRLWEEIACFAARIGPAGAINGLTQAVLHMTTPGVPDLYQGAELWDGSLVDPDNRRPVDYARRRDMLATHKTPVQLLPDWQGGQIKQAVVSKTLHLRARLPRLFAAGTYQPLAIEGPYADHVIAFVREAGREVIVAIATIRATPLLQDASTPLIPAAAWQDTTIVLPTHQMPARFINIFDDTTISPENGRVAVGTLLAALPVSVLTRAA